MHEIIGCDEAGYGPNLGPLVISATVWQLPPNVSAEADLYELLSEIISAAPGSEEEGQLAVADSKRLYKSGGDYRCLEEAVLVGLGSVGKSVRTWRELWMALAVDSVSAADEEPWHDDYDRELPVDADIDVIAKKTDRFGSFQTAVGVKLAKLRSACVFPARFNSLCDHFDSKGLVLSTCTLKLIAGLVAESSAKQITVFADKHGGRNRYGGLIQEAFNDRWVEVRRESRAESCYRLRDGSRTIDFYFRVGGEDSLPTAWASLCCKYLRELAMDAFNAYWLARVPGIRPTAGYPVDAKRFMEDIAEALAAEAIPRDVIWRTR